MDIKKILLKLLVLAALPLVVLADDVEPEVPEPPPRPLWEQVRLMHTDGNPDMKYPNSFDMMTSCERADLNNDGHVDPLDFIYMVKIVYKGASCE